ncbi:MAG: nucleotide sugar dehydrogenase [Candidatus Nanoarchaeia archaeon]|nr:nucleotide sugar dehydrogenase [Candidatus Nanoarchaeia archaeon]
MMSLEKKIAVFGLGHIGLPFTAALAHVGFEVIGVDPDRAKIDGLNRGEVPFYEPGMAETLNRNKRLIKYTTDADTGVKDSDAIFITVGTPLKSDHTPDYSQIDSCTREIAKNLRRGQLVVLKSTVVLGTTENYFKPNLESASGLKAGTDFYLAFCPERTVEGLAMHELYTLPKIIGGINPESSEQAKRILERLGGSVTIVSSPRVAEMCKLADNIYRATNIGLGNEFGLLCEQASIDSGEFIAAVNKSYPRTNLFRPGLGADGPCLEKDPCIFRYSAQQHGISRTPMIDACIEQSDYSTLRLADMAEGFRKANGLEEIDLAMIGLSFKGFPETDDLRGSPALKILEKMKADRTPLRTVKLYDPLVEGFPGQRVCKTLDEALDGSNVAMFLTNHPQIMRLNPQKIAGLLGKPSLLIDAWGNLDGYGQGIAGVTYFRVGKGYVK